MEVTVSTSELPRFSVIVPCYQYGRFLEECVRSVLSQADVSVRVLVIDDASTDDTQPIGLRLSRSDPRVEYRRHTVNMGAIATYNEGLAWIEDDHALLLSADDALLPGALRRAAAVFANRPDVGLVTGEAQVVKETLPPAEADAEGKSYKVKVHRVGDFARHLCDLGRNPVRSPTAMVRTKVQREAGLYSPSLPHTADLEMWLRLSARSAVAELGACQAWYRRHGQNMSNVRHSYQVEDFQYRAKTFEKFFREHQDFFPDWIRLKGRSLRRLAEEAFVLANDLYAVKKRKRAREMMELSRRLQDYFRATIEPAGRPHHPGTAKT